MYNVANTVMTDDDKSQAEPFPDPPTDLPGLPEQTSWQSSPSQISQTVATRGS